MAKSDRKRRAAKLNEQRKRANIRAKYGPAMKPAPVIVIRPGGEIAVVDQSEITRARRAAPAEVRPRATKRGRR
jgi:hypothetical protein